MEDLDALFDAAIAAYKKTSRWKYDNPYVADLISILKPHKETGLHVRDVTQQLRKMRLSKDILPASEMRQAVQSALQRHAAQYAGFRKRRAPAGDDLFYAAQGFGKGYWAVRLDKATAWLIAKNKLAPD